MYDEDLDKSTTEYICPHCGNPIYDDEALLCLYCGENLERGVGTLGKLRYSSHWIVFIFVIVLLIFAFIILMVR